MKITIISLFPEFYQSFLEHSIIKRAIEKNKVEIEVFNPRTLTTDGQVDDYLYGGGPGMLLMIEPIVKAIEKFKSDSSYIILTSAKGQPYNQAQAEKLSNYKHLIIVSGHYEGVDARIKYYIDQELSIGEYIITGGESPSLIIADSIIRLLPGVINQESLTEESFNNDLIECDHYTKPQDFRGYKVPEILLSGNHQEIAKWKKNNSLVNTINYNKQKKEKNDCKSRIDK